MIILIHGDDSFRTHEKVRQLQEKFTREVDPSGLNRVVVEAQDLEAGQWSREITTTPFLARRRMIVARGVLTTSAARAMLEKEETQWWKIALSSESDSPIVVMAEPADLAAQMAPRGKKPVAKPAQSDFADRLLAQATVVHNAVLTGVNRKQWIREYVRERAGTIEDAAVSLLTSVELDSWSLAKLLDTCIAYRWQPGRGDPITKDDCLLRIPETSEGTLFPLQDAFMARRPAESFREEASLRFAGTHSLQILSMLERSVLQLGQLKAGTLPQTTHPYVVRKVTAAAKGWQASELRATALQLLLTDLTMKSTDLDDRALITRLLI